MGEAQGLASYSRPSVNPADYVNNLWDPANKATLDYLMDVRKLDDRTIRNFQIGCNERGDIAIPVFKDSVLIDYKFRSIADKHFYRTPYSETWVVNDPDGFVQAEAKGKLLVTEGEIDAFSAWQLGIRWVVSSVGGAGEVRRAEWIEKIPKDCSIYICYDNDEVGQRSARELAERIGFERCKNVILPEVKDTNEFLQNGGTSERYLELVKNGKRFEADGVSKVADVLEQLQENPTVKEPIHIERFNKFTKGGIPHRALVMISGRYGTGKSSFLLNLLIHHANQGKPVLLITLENDMMLTLQRFLEVKYRQPLSQFSPEMWEKVKKELVDYPFYIDMSMQSYTMPQIEKVISQSKKLYGIEFFGYDHLHWSVERSRPEDLEKISKDFKILANEKNVIAYVVCHVRKEDKDRKIITGEDLKGSSGMAQLANVIILLQNFGAGLILNLDKSRESRSHLTFPVTFNGETGVIEDDPARKIRHFDQDVDDEEAGDRLVVPQVIDIEPTRTIIPAQNQSDPIDGY
jgi:twinkle protein